MPGTTIVCMYASVEVVMITDTLIYVLAEVDQVHHPLPM